MYEANCYWCLERAEELKLRIKKLVTVLVDELTEKKSEDEVQAKLWEDIQSLSRHDVSCLASS